MTLDFNPKIVVANAIAAGLIHMSTPAFSSANLVRQKYRHHVEATNYQSSPAERKQARARYYRNKKHKP